jgi:glycerol-3-phosphate cytidylyltransferase
VLRVLTYGTFDLLHHGHIRILQRAKALGDYLVVAVSTDEFNEGKGKKAFHDYALRKEVVESIRYVDLVIPESSWEQKLDDVKRYDIDIVVMGDDWAESGWHLHDRHQGRLEQPRIGLARTRRAPRSPGDGPSHGSRHPISPEDT